MGGAGGGGDARGGIAACVPETDWKADDPHFGQKATPGLISNLQLEQIFFCCGASERPQPLQNVSPASYGVLQLEQRSDGVYTGVGDMDGVDGVYDGTDGA